MGVPEGLLLACRVREDVGGGDGRRVDGDGLGGSSTGVRAECREARGKGIT